MASGPRWPAVAPTQHARRGGGSLRLQPAAPSPICGRLWRSPWDGFRNAGRTALGRQAVNHTHCASPTCATPTSVATSLCRTPPPCPLAGAARHGGGERKGAAGGQEGVQRGGARAGGLSAQARPTRDRAPGAPAGLLSSACLSAVPAALWDARRRELQEREPHVLACHRRRHGSALPAAPGAAWLWFSCPNWLLRTPLGCASCCARCRWRRPRGGSSGRQRRQRGEGCEGPSWRGGTKQQPRRAVGGAGGSRM